MELYQEEEELKASFVSRHTSIKMVDTSYFVEDMAFLNKDHHSGLHSFGIDGSCYVALNFHFG